MWQKCGKTLKSEYTTDKPKTAQTRAVTYFIMVGHTGIEPVTF